MSGDERASDDTATLTVAEPSGVDVDRLPIEKDTGLIGERYALLGIVGRGGMGAVLRAYDSRLRREVALKRLLPGKDAPEARARMIREAQAMAQLSHPNVVAVYDVDVINDMILIAMEYVQGQTLRRWLKTERSVREIVEAFIMAAEGLAAAHDAGLVHRDFKPANVLVGSGHQIKVTDFGLAKPADGEEIEPERASADGPFNSEHSSGTVTQHNAVLGTPRYMAPEQHTGDPAGAPADQYALCIALWEALTGAPPFRGEGMAGLLAAKRAGPPAAPSVRALPRATMEALRRGLHPDPEARWPSVRALIEQLRETPRRQRVVLAVGATAIVGAAAFVSTRPAPESPADPCAAGDARIAEVWSDSTRGAMAASMATVRGFGAESFPRIEARVDRYARSWAAAYDDACAATHVRREQSSEALDLRMACLDRRRRELAATVELLQEGNADIVRRGLDAVAALATVDQCADVEALKRAVPRPSDPRVAERVEEILAELARTEALRSLGQFARALEVVENLIEQAQPLDYAPLGLRLKARRGELLVDLDREEGDALLQEVLPVAIEMGLWRLVFRVSIRLSQSLSSRELRIEEAKTLATMAVGHARRIDPGGLLEGYGHQQLGEILGAQGDTKAAIDQYEQALAIRREHMGDDAPDVAKSLNQIAVMLGRRGEYDRAKSTLAEVLAITERLRGTNHPLMVRLLQSSAIMHGRTGDYEGAAERFERALGIRLAIDGGETRGTARIRINLATAYKSLKRVEDAERHLTSARETVERVLGADSPRLADVLHALAAVRVQQGRREQALVLQSEAIAIYEKAHGPEHATLGTFLYNHADQLQRAGRFAEARDEFERSLNIRDKTDAPPEYRADTAVHLSDCLFELDEDRERAIELLDRALVLYDKAQIDTTKAAQRTREKLAARRAE